MLITLEGGRFASLKSVVRKFPPVLGGNFCEGASNKREEDLARTVITLFLLV